MAKVTIKGLQAQLDLLKTAYDESRVQLHNANGETREVKNQRDSVVTQFNNLKERLATAEFENQRLRGYIERVQEDDVVREELVVAGDPDGQVQLTPKRKHTRFEAPNHRSNAGEIADDFMHRHLHGEDEMRRRKPKHWVTY